MARSRSDVGAPHAPLVVRDCLGRTLTADEAASAARRFELPGRHHPREVVTVETLKVEVDFALAHGGSGRPDIGRVGRHPVPCNLHALIGPGLVLTNRDRYTAAFGSNDGVADEPGTPMSRWSSSPAATIRSISSVAPVPE